MNKNEVNNRHDLDSDIDALRYLAIKEVNAASKISVITFTEDLAEYLSEILSKNRWSIFSDSNSINIKHLRKTTIIESINIDVETGIVNLKTSENSYVNQYRITSREDLLLAVYESFELGIRNMRLNSMRMNIALFRIVCLVILDSLI